MVKYTFSEITHSYNAIMHILRGLSNPAVNHTSEVMIKRWQPVTLTALETRIIREELFGNKNLNHIIAPYCIEYTDTTVYIIFDDGHIHNYDFYKVESVFKNTPNKVFILVNEDAFLFKITDNADVTDIIDTYFTIFSCVLFDDFYTACKSKNMMIMWIFFSLLFLKTTSTITDNELKEYFKFNKIITKNFGTSIDNVLDDVDNCIKKAEEFGINTVNYTITTGTSESDYSKRKKFAEYINDICDRYSIEDYN